jgi:hypothetical protein
VARRNKITSWSRSESKNRSRSRSKNRIGSRSRNLGCRRPLSVGPSCWPLATPAQDFDMVGEPRMSVLSSSPLRCSHSGTRRRRGGGPLGTDFSAACTPASPPATYVLVLGLPIRSPTPSGVSMWKGGVFGWARLARASTLSSFRLCGTCLVPPCSGSRVQAWCSPCSATKSQVSVPCAPT